MSSYLNFYVVPKGGEPLLLTFHSRSSEVYQTFYEELNPPFMVNDKTYIELTTDDIERVLFNSKEYLEKTIDNFNRRVQAYKSLSDKIPDDAVEDWVSTTKYIEELKLHINTLEYISHIVNNLKFSDFEKVLLNIS